jgi:hypothetical protein
LSSDEDSKKGEASNPNKTVISAFTGDLSHKKEETSEEEVPPNPPLAGKLSNELACQMTLEDLWSLKDPGMHKML